MKKKFPVLLFSGLLLSACASGTATQSSTAKSSQKTATVKTTKKTSGYYGKYESEDSDESSTDAVKVDLSENTQEAEGVSVKDQTVTITKGGTYLLTGELAGQVIVKAAKTEKVHLILNGVTIENKSGPAIDIEQAEKVTMTLQKDSLNTLTDGTDYSLADNATEPDAALYSKEDLSLNGSGKLVVTGNYSNGIRSKDDLVISSGEYEVTAKNNALKGKDSVSIKSGTFTLKTTEGDAVQSDNTASGKGTLAIDGGTFTITSGRDGIQAATDLLIQNAKITIKTADGAATADPDKNESYKGLKAGNSIQVSSGTVAVDSADDAVHSDQDVIISGGTFTLSSGDDGIHADQNLTIKNGKITIEKSYEGLEASVIDYQGGTTRLTASDDGVNAGGGSDTDQSSGKFGADSFGGGPGGGDQADSSKQVKLSGGILVVDAEGDGLDSNGNIEMSDGVVVVNGPTRGGNGALDYNGTFTLTGGTLAAAGTTDMAQNVSDTSTQTAVKITFDQQQAKDTLISLKNESGDTVISFAAAKAFQSLILSTPALKSGNYTLTSGGTNSGTDESGVYLAGKASGDTTLGTLKISSTVANLTQSGEASSGQGTPGGAGGPGGK